MGNVKENVMMIALRAKFDKYPELKQVLLSTAGNSLVDHRDNDNYWGDAGDGSRLNILGDLLVELREYYLDSDITAYMMNDLLLLLLPLLAPLDDLVDLPQQLLG
ncbi:MAG: NADAR domain-containing protein [Flammeovirgaceae bacterium]